jgi:DNA-binding SARP family transcriptional activator
MPSPARLSVGLLGPLVASRAHQVVNLGGRRQRAVVAVLVLARGQQVSTARLLDALWNGMPPASGAANLQAYVSHLRRALEPERAARTPSSVLVSSADGYAIPLAAVEVDAWRFERMVEGSGNEPDPATRVTLLHEALALWRGTALVEYAGSDWADVEARRLEEIRELARERLLDARLECGQAAKVVPEIEALLGEQPLREERWRLFALALYRSHRQADALAALRRARAHLADELGVDPGAALRALEAEVLAQSPGLEAPVTPTRRPELHAPGRRRRRRSGRPCNGRGLDLRLRRGRSRAAHGPPADRNWSTGMPSWRSSVRVSAWRSTESRGWP